MALPPQTNALGPDPRGSASSMRFGPLGLPFAIPILIGPPSLLTTGAIDLGWIGAGVTIAGTYLVTRDAVYCVSPLRKNAVALLLAFLFCACWVAIAWGALVGLVSLFPDSSSD